MAKADGYEVSRLPRVRKEDPWEGACPKRRAFPNSCAVRCQTANRGPGPGGGLDYDGGLIRAARRLGTSALPAPPLPGAFRCRASAGIRTRLAGEPAPSLPIRHGESRRARGFTAAPRIRKADPWEGACPKRRAFPNSCAVRCQTANRGPGPGGGLDYDGGGLDYDGALIRVARRLGTSALPAPAFARHPPVRGFGGRSTGSRQGKRRPYGQSR